MMLFKILKIVLCLLLFNGCSQKKKLPILSNYINNQGQKVSYTINNFNFTTQLGKEFTVDDTKDKVYIANFFFTSCPSICPPMRAKLIDLANTFKNEKFMILSFTIDPENDSIAVLKEYGEATEIAPHKWFFLSGDSIQLSNIAKKFRTSFSKNNDGTDFYHSSFVALVDSKQRIRGFYNILEKEAVLLLKKDVTILLKENY
ncbi:MAG: SCO family protein [Flavobacteriaceae bacterium]|nr:SCO family protein [Flavobacteriaceae bacterium]